MSSPFSSSVPTRQSEGKIVVSTTIKRSMPLPLAVAASVVAASVAGCASSSTQRSTPSSSPTPSGVSVAPINVRLGDQPSGTATLSWDPASKYVTAQLQMVGFTPGSSHAMHIYQGSCASPENVTVAFPDVTANQGGAIDTAVSSLQPSDSGVTDGTLLSIHLAPSSQLGSPGSLGYTPVSCGDISPSPAGSTAQTLTMTPPPQPGQRPAQRDWPHRRQRPRGTHSPSSQIQQNEQPTLYFQPILCGDIGK